MAKPNIHFGVTIALLVFYGLVIAPLSIFQNGMWYIIWFSTLLIGVLIDVDHASLIRIKEALRGVHGPIPGWNNYLHSWVAFWLIIAACIYFWVLSGSYLPLLAYILHILIDSANRSNENSGPMGISAVPNFLYRFCPEWLKYGYR